MFKRSNYIISVLTMLMLFTMLSYSQAEEVLDPNNTPVPDVLVDAGGDYQVVDNIDPEEVKIILNFQDTLVADVLDYLSEKAGLVIIADAYPSGRISLVSKQPLNIDEVVTLLTTILKQEGYAAIRSDRTLKLVTLTQAKQSNVPVTSGNNPDKIPENDDVVTHIIPIRYADAVQLMEDISALVSDYATLASNESSNSLIITDTNNNIKRLVRIVQALDTQMAGITTVKVFRLVYADAEDTADLINQVFEQQQSQSSSSRNQNPFARFMRGGRGGPGDDNQSTQQAGTPAISVPVVADADERTNSVVVSGSAEVLEVITEVVKELDSNPTEERSIFVYKLKYAQAETIKEELNSLFQELQSLNDQNSNSRSAGGPQMGNFGRTTSSTSSSSDLSEETYIEADEETNSLLIMTSQKNYQQIKTVIDSLDVTTPQVLIKVLIAELTTTDGSDIGVSWTLFNERSSGDSILNEFVYTPLPTEGFTSQVIDGDLTITLRALQEVGQLNILSRPYIMTSNNQTATINVGQRYPFITDSQITDAGNTINTVDYEDIGITLEVTPNINIDGLVIMDVNPEITTAIDDTVQISEVVNATIFATRSAECRVAVPNGKTVVIGGLMQDNETENTEKVPLLGDLPLVGGLFKRTVVDNEKTELLIFLTPQVAMAITDVEKISEHERSLSKFINAEEGNETLREHIEKMESVYQTDTDTPE